MLLSKFILFSVNLSFLNHVIQILYIHISVLPIYNLPSSEMDELKPPNIIVSPYISYSYTFSNMILFYTVNKDICLF